MMYEKLIDELKAFVDVGLGRLVDAVKAVAAAEDNEATDTPVWYVVDPRQMMKLDPGVLMSMITGPFFSRASAENHLKERRYGFSDKAVVWCDSAFRSDEYKELYRMSKKLNRG